MFRVKLLTCFKRVLLRQNLAVRIAYYTTVTALMFITFFLVNYHYKQSVYTNVTYFQNTKKLTALNKTKVKTAKIKYILLWTDRKKYPFIYFGEGTSVFELKKCKWANCYVTGERYILGDYTKFDTIVFNGPQLQTSLYMEDLPQYRSVHQKYVFANIEAASNYRMCSNVWNGYFNWTWTYKLNSDAVWGYFIVKNASNHVIGPSLNVQWIDSKHMDPIDDSLKLQLNTKKQAAAWFVSNCYTLSRREEYAKNIQNQLSNYNLTLDIYGDCGQLQCPKGIMNRCLKLLQNNYYFYLAFENALSEDYVTEKVLYALNYNTVPVVLGGANYSRFLPPDSFLDALLLGPEKLAETMHTIIQTPTLYYKFFRWKKYYSFHLRHESPNTDDYCNFCAMVNDDQLMKTNNAYEDFDSWWKSLLKCDLSR